MSQKPKKPRKPRKILPGIHKPAEFGLKAELVAELARILDERDLTQADASRLLGIKQPDLSKILGRDAKGYSVGLLMRMLTGFSLDVEVTTRPHRKAGQPGRMMFKRR